MTNEVKFGRREIGKPIPANLIFWCRVYTAVGAVLMIAVKSAPFIDTGSILQQSCEWFFTSTIGIANVMLPMFGVQVSESTVPTGDVTAMETETKE